MDNVQLKHEMAQFTGTEHYYRHALGRMMYTDGVKLFAENAGGGAYWLLDIVGTELMQIHELEQFISIKLNAQDNKVDISAKDGNYTSLYKRHIEFTDCPDGEWEFYLIDGIMLLTREY